MLCTSHFIGEILQNVVGGGWAWPALYTLKRMLSEGPRSTLWQSKFQILLGSGARPQIPPYMTDTSWSLSPINNISLQSILHPSALHFKFFHYNLQWCCKNCSIHVYYTRCWSTETAIVRSDIIICKLWIKVWPNTHAQKYFPYGDYESRAVRALDKDAGEFGIHNSTFNQK